MTIIVTKDGLKPEKIHEAGFEKESELQEYLMNNPEIIPLDKIEDHKRLLTLAREFQTGSGYIDAIAIDNDGEVYIIETKLYKNTDKRYVLAQVLDYGSALWVHDDAKYFINSLSQACYAQFNTSIQERMKKYFNLNSDDIDKLTEKVRHNFERGKFKFLILMDSLNTPLKQLILYINQHSTFDIYAVEIKHYKTNGISIIIPSIFGAEISSRKYKNDIKKWNFETFAKERLVNCGGKEIIELVKKIIDFAKENSIKIDWGKSKRGSFIITFESAGKPVYLLSIHGNCAIEWNLPHQGGKAPEPFDSENVQIRILKMLSQNFSEYVNIDAPNKYSAVNIPLSELKNEIKLKAFFDFLLYIKSLCK